MGINSKIEWTHHTFNPWWGCVKVSPACKHCYAEAWSKRVGENIWGSKTNRRFFSDNHWREPLRWNILAEKEKVRRRVFCASMADVFEPRKELNPWRDRLWELILLTPWLDWLLLTKRPGSINSLAPWTNNWPHNVWLGTTAENQLWADKRIPLLLRNPAHIHFLSCEPLLSDINLSQWIEPNNNKKILDWVITGGESGPKARPMNPKWVKSIRDQCTNQNVAFHFKQWGHWAPLDALEAEHMKSNIITTTFNECIKLAKVGKNKAGRTLDGRTWDEFPEHYG
ncbi:MAG: phage Gp37/Gp68 family protein [Shewanella sp.]|nr:phage Gp37/Gp68 family protein [Shewanella sp.]